LYQKYLTLLLFTLISGNVINISLQSINFYDLFAAEDNSQSPEDDNQPVEEERNEPPEDDNQPVEEERNEPPKADDQKVSVDANDNVKINLEGNDDDKGDEIKFDVVADPSHGTLDNFDKSDGTVTYVPEKDYSGDDKFKFKVTDDKGADSDSATVDIIVKATNQAPKADDQKVSVDANDNVKINLEGNDDDKGDEIKFDVVADPSHGTLDNFDKSDGTVTYVPEKDYSGDDKFKFKVTDDKGADSNAAEVKISFKSIIQPKQGVGNETNQGVGDETNQGVGNETNQGVGNETNQGVGDETNQGVGNETNQGLVDETNQGVDNQTSIADGQNNSVNTENQSPIAYDQSLTVDANNKIDVALVGDDADNDTIQFAIVSNPSDASLDNFDMAKGTVTYTPHLDYVGNDSFAFKVIDDKAVESNIATVNVDVKATTKELSLNDSANQSPTAFDQSTSVYKNSQLNITLVGDDADNDTIQFAIVSNPSDASLDNFDMAKGTVTYTPHLDYIGNDSFAFNVIDDKAVESNIATVNVDVKENNQTNQAPQAFNQSTNESNLSDYRYLTWSAGEDEDRYILFARSTDGGKTYSSPVSLSGNIHSDVFNPAVSSSGNDVYVVWQGLSKNGNQDIFLRKSTDYGSSFGKAENISNDPGGSGNPEVEIVGNSTHVAWEGTTPGNNFIFYTTSDDGSGYDSPQKLSSNIGISYKPEIIVKDSPSSDSFTYKVTDEKGAQSNVATVDVNIDTIDQSKLEDDAKSVSVDSNQEIDITLKAKDKDNDTLQYEIVTPPSDGTLDNFDPNSGTVTYVPDNDNEVDISWHNYNNGRDRTMTKIVDNGDSDGTSSAEIENDDPFKAKR
jgi:large repetitive protein